MELKKSTIWSVCISMLIIILMIGQLSKSGINSELKIASSDVYELNQGWEVTYKDTCIKDISLPFKVKLLIMESIYAKRVLPENLTDNSSLRFRASMQKIKVMIDGQLIYEGKLADDNKIHMPEASIWIIVPIPNNSQGKTIEVQIQSPVNAFSGLINSIYYGKSDALLYKTFSDSIISVTVALVLILVGLLSFIISLFVRKLADRRIFYLGLFATFVGIWLLSEAKVMQFFTGNRFIIGGISYISLSFIPIPLLLYLRDTTLQKYYRYFYFPIGVFLSSFFINLSLQLFGIFHYIEIIGFTNVFMFLTLLVLISVLIYESVKYKNSEAKRFLLSLSVMGIVLGVELYGYFSENYLSISTYMRFGILVFFGLLIMDSFKYINAMILKQNETSLFERLAYIDILTGAKNRTAFERDIHNLVRDSNDKLIHLILFDIDNLKLINDRHGHKAGDLAIMSTYECIQDTFNNCYRIGGDEFACLSHIDSEDKLIDQIDELRAMLVNKSKELTYIYEISAGAEVFNPLKDEFDEVFNRADQKLYQDKKNKQVFAE